MCICPAGLPGSALDAAQHLRWHVSGNHLQAENTSPYYVTITTLTCAGQNQKTPLEHSVLPLTAVKSTPCPARPAPAR